MADVVTFNSLTQQIRKKSFSPVYLLHGEEGYYIDRLVQLFENSVPEEDRDFNFYTIYAAESDPDTVIDTCRRYPMMADRQYVVLREAQSVSAAYINKLQGYVANPSETTVLVICFRGTQAKGKEFLTSLKKGGGVVFESKKLSEWTAPKVVKEMISEKGLNIDDRSLQLLCEHVGTDLSRINNEITKLTVALPVGASITPEVIELNIGISKDFNNFELVSAVASRDYAKTVKIARYYRADPKNHPAFAAATMLFTLFSNVLAAFYAPDKSDRGLMELFGFRFPGQLTDVKKAFANYKAWQVIEIISEIRRFDAMAKGVGSRWDQYDLFDSLLFRIMTAKGQVKLNA